MHSFLNPWVAGAGVAAGLMVAPLTAQEAHVKIASNSDASVQWSIATKSSIKNSRKTIVDGEEREGRNRGGGGPVQSSQNVVFVQGPAGSWRQYITAAAEVTRGEGQSQKIVSALQGKKVAMEVKDGKLVFTPKSEAAAEGDAKDASKKLPRNATAGIEQVIDLSGLASKQAVAVQGTYEIGDGLVAAMKHLLHPVRAAGTGNQGRRRGQGQGQGRGRGRQRGGQGQRGQGQRGQGQGQRGQGRQRRNRGRAQASTFNATALRILGSAKLQTKATGTLVGLEAKDGTTFATVKIQGTVAGKGTAADLGMGRQTRRRGGQGGNGGNANPGAATVQMNIAGTMVVNQSTHQVTSLRLNCKVETSQKAKRSRQGREMELHQSSAGALTIEVNSSVK